MMAMVWERGQLKKDNVIIKKEGQAADAPRAMNTGVRALFGVRNSLIDRPPSQHSTEHSYRLLFLAWIQIICEYTGAYTC